MLVLVIYAIIDYVTQGHTQKDLGGVGDFGGRVSNNFGNVYAFIVQNSRTGRKKNAFLGCYNRNGFI